MEVQRWRGGWPIAQDLPRQFSGSLVVHLCAEVSRERSGRTMHDCRTGLFISYVVGSWFHMLRLEGQHATYDPHREKVSDRRGSLGNIRAADLGPICFFVLLGSFECKQHGRQTCPN